jgi:hypothetical protein
MEANAETPYALAELVVQGAVGLGTILIALAALYVARGTHRAEKESFLIAIRREWEELRPDWNRSLMYVNGADHYYHEVSPRERVEHAKRVKKFSGDPEVFNTKSWEWVRDQRATVSKTVRFLSYASDALLTGRWTLREAYALFGPDVARHYQTILWMSHRKPSAKVPFASPGDGKEWQQSIDQLPEFNFYDSQDALVVLAFLLRAEQCRRGDTHGWFVSDLATELRGSWNVPVRDALSRASHARGRWFPRASLRLSLHRARHPWKRSGYQFEREALGMPEMNAEHFQRPYETKRGNGRRIGRISGTAGF